MLDRMPRLPLLTEPGDMVIVSSTKGADPGRVTALQLFRYRTAGNAMQARQAMQEVRQVEEPARKPASEWFWNRPGFGIGLPLTANGPNIGFWLSYYFYSIEL